jgi:hypothetical protein
MAQWYRDEDDRERNRRYGAWRERWEPARDRRMIDRGTDEVRSWFGDDEAERRRQMDRRWEDQRGDGGWRDRLPHREWRDEDRERYRMSGDTPDDWSAGPAGTRGYGRRRDSSADWSLSGESGSRHLSPTAWSYTEVWMIPGPHAGRGPNGYTRSDDRIREDICDRLTQHGMIDASQIDVVVSNGQVTLRGRVPDREASHEQNLESPLGIGSSSAEAKKTDRQVRRV